MKILEDMDSISTTAQIFGILPLVDICDNELKVTNVGKTYYYVLTVSVLLSSSLICGVVLFNASSFKIMQNVQGNTEEINQTIETLFCVISYTMIVISSISNAFRYTRTFQDIAKIDEQLTVDGFEGRYSCPLIWVLLLLVSLLQLVVAYFYIHVRSDIYWVYQIVLLTVYALQMLYSNLFAVCMRVLMKNISRRITFVNDKLEAFTKDDNEKKDNWRDLSNLIEMLCKFRYITENVNTATGVSLLFYMGFAFYTVTNQSYLAFSTLTTHVPFKEKFDKMGLSVTWVLVELTTMSVICSSCDALSSEANNTSLILARVYGKSKEYENIIDKYLTKSIKQDVQFTAYGFFVIDNSTLFKIFSAVTTYLVILIQFKQLEDSKTDA